MPPAAQRGRAAGRGRLAALRVRADLLNLVFFVVLSLVGGGLNQYLVVGLQALHGTPPAVGNTALTGLLAA